MQKMLLFLFWTALGCSAAYYAKQRGRNPYLWFLLSIFLGMIGLFVLFFLPKKKAEQPKEEPAEVPTPPNPLAAQLWYYLDLENKQYGPMSFSALQEAIKESKVTPQTYVWHENLDNWKTYEEATTSSP